VKRPTKIVGMPGLVGVVARVEETEGTNVLIHEHQGEGGTWVYTIQFRRLNGKVRKKTGRAPVRLSKAQIEALGQRIVRAQEVALSKRLARRRSRPMPPELVEAATRLLLGKRTLTDVQSLAHAARATHKEIARDQLQRAAEAGDYGAMNQFLAAYSKTPAPRRKPSDLLDLFLFAHWHSLVEEGVNVTGVHALAIKTLGADRVTPDRESFARHCLRRGVKLAEPGRPINTTNSLK